MSIKKFNVQIIEVKEANKPYKKELEKHITSFYTNSDKLSSENAHFIKEVDESKISKEILDELVSDSVFFCYDGVTYIFGYDEVFKFKKDFKDFCSFGKSYEELTAVPCAHCGNGIVGVATPNPVSGNEGFICQTCLEKIERKAIKQYTYKPVPKFHGRANDHMFVGAEIELGVIGYNDNVNGDYKNNVLAYKVQELSDKKVYCKEDGSIGGGFEMVTHPFTLSYERRTKSMKKLFDYIGSNDDFRAGRDDLYINCGVHIHVSSSAIPKDVAKKIRLFFINNKKFIMRISHRADINHINHYCSLDCLGQSNIIEAIDENNWTRSQHTSAINVTKSTYEFRIFNSTRNYAEFMSYVEFVYGIIGFCKSTDDTTLANFIKYMKENKYHNFINENSKVCA